MNNPFPARSVRPLVGVLGAARGIQNQQEEKR